MHGCKSNHLLTAVLDIAVAVEIDKHTFKSVHICGVFCIYDSHVECFLVC